MVSSILGDLEGDRRSMISPWLFPFPTLPEAIVCQTFRLLLPRVFLLVEGVALFEIASASFRLLFCLFSHSSLADSILFCSFFFFSIGTAAGFGVFLFISPGIKHDSLRSTYPLCLQVSQVFSPFIDYLVSHLVKGWIRLTML